ncbi:MAG: type II toxin-antitoxin system VapC family toxin [Odoribacteraceae bacterium]|jgi:tRNA(fMet)-specific endonuclease VapC|nr:type II toxin-antitoxin system VapC family toxin [Odoribacteraceae bacterium]
MKQYLLDTNICIFYLRGRYDINKRLNAIGLENCYISEITLAELKFGAECSDRVVETMQLVDDFVGHISVLPIYNCLGFYAKEKARLRKSGKIVDDFDLLIGCSAVVNNLILATENERHLGRIRKIIIENWITR